MEFNSFIVSYCKSLGRNFILIYIISSPLDVKEGWHHTIYFLRLPCSSNFSFKSFSTKGIPIIKAINPVPI